ncbi:MAG: DinB family protein [candidate division Zixibacteria bacterium]|nr:DinB family protein [candidate division Zixibacteria bacterium]MBU1471675.1 DinB family protein [candidate division Zixibacteria bacterium]MBU2625429.1 DinB family protein [candidate division Zixibacteria bacterium]
MDAPHMIETLKRNRKLFKKLFEGTTVEQARWKPAQDKWSMLQVMNHLYDEERDDFRMRLSLILEDPELDWPPINPDQKAIDEDYNSKDLAETLKKFSEERKASIKWLESLDNPDWDIEKTHPRAGSLKAGDLLSSWVIHDFLHLRQLANILIKYTASMAQPYATDYAGPQ